MLADYCGWIHNPDGVARIIGDGSVPVWEMTDLDRHELRCGDVMGRMETDKPPIMLTDALLESEPGWKRDRQGIGDCVSFGFELCASLVHAVDINIHGLPWLWHGPYATEPIYGGSRAEARGVKTGGWSDGSYGAAAAKWLTKWGALLRADYSKSTGNADHDLRVYSADRAKQWGNYGCGGAKDSDKLDMIAKETPVKSAHLVRSFLDGAAAIESGYPLAVCSGQGFGARGKDGFAPATGSWAHCMCFAGLRYDIPALLLLNSWGNSWGTTAPFYPANYPHLEVLKCAAWVRADVVTSMFAQWEDSFALTGIQGLKRREIDWSKGWEVKGR